MENQLGDIIYTGYKIEFCSERFINKKYLFLFFMWNDELSWIPKAFTMYDFDIDCKSKLLECL